MSYWAGRIGLARWSQESLRVSLPSGGNPLSEIKQLEQVIFVMKGGIVVKDERKLAR